MNAVGDILKRVGLYPLARRAQGRTRDISHAIRAGRAMMRYKRSCADFGLNDRDRGFEITVSFTTHPKRVPSAARVADAMLRQTVKPDRVLLVLAPNEWASAEARSLLESFKDRHANLLSRGLQIVWGDDVRSHNKYVYAFRNHPGSFVVTVDDDMLYPPSLLEGLLAMHREHPGAVIAAAGCELALDGPTLSREDAVRRVEKFGAPSMSIMAVGCNGVLYPPGVMSPCLDELTDAREMMRLAPTDDDMWLKFHEVKHGIPVAVTPPGEWSDLRQIPGTWGSGLVQQNYFESRFERTAMDCVRHFGITREDLLRPTAGAANTA